MKTTELWNVLQTAESIRDSRLSTETKLQWLTELQKHMPPMSTCLSALAYELTAAGITSIMKEVESAKSVSAEATASEPVVGPINGSGSIGGSTEGQAEASHKGKETRSPSKAKNR